MPSAAPRARDRASGDAPTVSKQADVLVRYLLKVGAVGGQGQCLLGSSPPQSAKGCSAASRSRDSACHLADT
jgi:hypothetical protein